MTAHDESELYDYAFLQWRRHDTTVVDNLACRPVSRAIKLNKISLHNCDACPYLQLKKKKKKNPYLGSASLDQE